MDNDIPVTQIRTMNDLMLAELSQPRFATVLLSTFAGLAILLTVVGLYGVMTYSVSRRTREIGVRMALGAQRRAVLTMVLRDAAILLAAGIVAGSAAVLGFASVFRKIVHSIAPRNPRVPLLVS